MKDIDLRVGGETVTIEINDTYVDMWERMEDSGAVQMPFEEMVAEAIRNSREQLETMVEQGVVEVPQEMLSQRKQQRRQQERLKSAMDGADPEVDADGE